MNEQVNKWISPTAIYCLSTCWYWQTMEEDALKGSWLMGLQFCHLSFTGGCVLPSVTRFPLLSDKDTFLTSEVKNVIWILRNLSSQLFGGYLGWQGALWSQECISSLRDTLSVAEMLQRMGEPPRLPHYSPGHSCKRKGYLGLTWDLSRSTSQNVGLLWLKA